MTLDAFNAKTDLGRHIPRGWKWSSQDANGLLKFKKARGNLSGAFLSASFCLLWLSLSAYAQFDARDQKDAVREYPSLAIAGSPLHQKFIELYQQAKAEKRPEILFRPGGGALQMARQAATILGEKSKHSALQSDPDPAEVATLGFPLQTMAIFLPSSSRSDQKKLEILSGEGVAKWRSEHGYHLTLAVHFFSANEGEIPKINQGKTSSPVIEFLSDLAAAYAVKDLHRVDALSLPEGNRELEEAYADPVMKKIFADPFIDSMPKRVPVRLRALLYLGKRLLALYDLPGGEIGQTVLTKRGQRYFIAEHLPEEYGIETEFFCLHLGNFLERSTNSLTDIIVR